MSQAIIQPRLSYLLASSIWGLGSTDLLTYAVLSKLCNKGDVALNSAKLISADDAEIPTISIIVVSYNTREMTLECLRSAVKEAEHYSYELIVIDNASEDGSFSAIKEEFPAVVGIKNETNLGFAVANNVASERARGEFLLLLNPDTVVLDHAVDRLIGFARKRPQAKIWGGRTLNADRSLNPKNCYRKKSIWNLFCRSSGLAHVFPNSDIFHSEGYGGWQRDSEREVDIVVGCFFLMKLKDWKALSGFDKDFFMYGEEADLCLRATEKGARPRVTPNATIIHYGGASERVREDKMVRLLASNTKLIRRYFPSYLSGLGIWLLKIWPWSRMLAYGFVLLFKKKDTWVEQHQTWHGIWKRRSQWAKP